MWLFHIFWQFHSFGLLHILCLFHISCLFIITIGALVYLGLHLVMNRTRLGAEVRAGVDDAETASALGVPVERTFFLVFLLGCALAGLAGAVAMPAFAAEAGMGVEILVPTLVVVVVRGLGSLKGALVGSLVIGATLTFGTALFPSRGSPCTQP